MCALPNKPRLRSYGHPTALPWHRGSSQRPVVVLKKPAGRPGCNDVTLVPGNQVQAVVQPTNLLGEGMHPNTVQLALSCPI